LAEVAQSSFGGEVDKVTPLQMALIAATVANGGVMMAPHLVKDFEDASGHQVRRYRDHSLGRVTSPRAARDVTTGMVYVVEHGSGFKSQILGIKVAGKTGTAQAHAFYPHAWFIAFAPAHNPVVAVAVLREYAGEGFEFAAPLARRVLVTALRERGYKVR
jgi:peptidoglycan glycosyltransferase